LGLSNILVNLEGNRLTDTCKVSQIPHGEVGLVSKSHAFPFFQIGGVRVDGIGLIEQQVNQTSGFIVNPFEVANLLWQVSLPNISPL
jgi:hypothetical protein